MRRTIGCFAISGCVGLSFTWAAVLGEVGEASQEPAPAAAKGKKAAGEARAVVQHQKSPFEEAVPVPPKAVDGAAIAVQKQAVVNALRIRAAAQPAQANRAPLTQQFTNQARPLLRAELIFARNVCQLNRDELRKVNRDAQEMLGQVVEKLVDAQFQPRARVQTTGRMPNGVDSHQLLADGVTSVMKKNLSAEQWARYEPQKLKRDENRKRTTIRYFVDAIDRELYLSPRQCEQLAAGLNDSWDPAWTMYLENHLFGNKYYPITIDPLVTPLLSDAQKRVWGGVQKVGVYWGFAGMLAGFVNDADGLEIELGEPVRAGAPAKNGYGPARARATNLKGAIVQPGEGKVGAAKADVGKAKREIRDAVQKDGRAAQ